MEKKIVFRAVMEVLGKPKEHVESSLKGYLKGLSENEDYKILRQEISEIKQQDDSDFWAVFAEVEVETSKIENLITFCFDYMPSLIEIIQPSEMKLSDLDISNFLNDLQAKLHGVDMVAKQLKVENDTIKHSSSILLKNYVTLLLKQNNLTSDQMSKLTGIDKDRLEDFLDQLIDEGMIDLKSGLYYIKAPA